MAQNLFQNALIALRHENKRLDNYSKQLRDVSVKLRCYNSMKDGSKLKQDIIFDYIENVTCEFCPLIDRSAILFL